MRWPLVAAGGIVCAALGVGAWWVLGGDDGETAGPVVPQFVDDTAASGVVQRYSGTGEYFEGGGLATFDCDDDSFPDLYIAGGSETAGLFRNVSTVGGELRFEKVDSPVTDLTSVTGAYPIDIDSDGLTDLAVLRHAEGNAILRGLGDCQFEDATADLGIDPGTAWTTAFSATWEGANALPTIVFGNFRVPDTTDCATSVLLRPDATGNRYGTPIPLEPGYCTLSALFTDWNHTGRHDLRLANDRNYYLNGSEQLWRIEPGEAPTPYTEADGWQRLQIWGMGIASQDLDGDGLPEVFLTSQGDNKLQAIDGDGTRPAYRDTALDKGVTATRPYAGGDVLPSTAWHPEFADVNNDGRTDLFVTKGNVDAQPDYSAKDPNNLLLGTAGGSFVERGEQAGLLRFERGRGATVTDLNLDGLLDIVVVNREVNVTVWRNAGAGTGAQPAPLGNWAAIRLRQPAPNVDAIGTWIDVRTSAGVQQREVTIGGGHVSGDLGWIHLGLGDDTSVDVRVHWPDGTTGEWSTIEAGAQAVVDRLAGVEKNLASS